MGLRKNLISWDDLSEKKKASRSVSVSDFKAHYKTIAIKNSMILVLKKTQQPKYTDHRSGQISK